MVIATNGSQSHCNCTNPLVGFFGGLDPDLEKHAALISVFSILIAIVIFLIQIHNERKKDEARERERFHRIYDTIIEELRQHEDFMRSYPIIEDIDGASFRGVILRTEAYESLLHSGLFTRFKGRRTRDILATYYSYIKLHNHVQQERMLLKSQFLLDRKYQKLIDTQDMDTWRSAIETHDYLLHTYQEYIEKLWSGLFELLRLDIGQLESFEEDTDESLQEDTGKQTEGQNNKPILDVKKKNGAPF